LLAPWHPKQNKATKTTTTQKPNPLQQIKETKSSTTKSFAAAAEAVLFPFAKTHSCTTHQSFPLQQKNPPEANKQTYLLTYLLLQQQVPFIHILTTTKGRWRNERDEKK
jgi:hypothetical protein